MPQVVVAVQTRTRFKTVGIRGIIDPLLEYEYSREAYTTMTELGLLCTSFNKDERPNMKVSTHEAAPNPFNIIAACRRNGFLV